MKLLYVLGICLILCIQISHQLPFGGKKDRRLPGEDGNVVQVKPLTLQNKRFGKIWKTHGVRDVGEPDNTDERHPLIGVPSDFDIGVGVNSDSTDTGTKLETAEKDIQKVKRGWFKKLWKTIKGIVVGGLLGMIKRSANDQEQLPVEDELNSEDFDNVVIPDDIIEVDLGTDFTPENKAEMEKEIQIVKRGWIKKIRKKVKNVLTGAVVGSLIGSVVKRSNIDGSDDDEKEVKSNLPLLLKTLRLRPGTADQITEIVEKLGNNSEFQDAMVNEILNNENDEKDGDDEIVLERSGKAIRCRFVRGKYICF